MYRGLYRRPPSTTGGRGRRRGRVDPGLDPGDALLQRIQRIPRRLCPRGTPALEDHGHHAVGRLRRVEATLSPQFVPHPVLDAAEQEWMDAVEAYEALKG